MKRLSRRPARALSGALLAATALAGAVCAAPAAGAAEPGPEGWGEWEVPAADVVADVVADVEEGGFWNGYGPGGFPADAGAGEPAAVRPGVSGVEVPEAAGPVRPEAGPASVPPEAGLESVPPGAHPASLPPAPEAAPAEAPVAELPDTGASETRFSASGAHATEPPDADASGTRPTASATPVTELPGAGAASGPPGAELPRTGAAGPDAAAARSPEPAALKPAPRPGAPRPAGSAQPAEPAPDAGTLADGDGFEPPDRRTPASAFDYDADTDADRAAQLSHTGADLWLPLGSGLGGVAALGAGAAVVVRKRRNA